MFRFLLGMAVMAGLGAFLSKPGPQDAEAEMRTQLLRALATERVEGKTAAETAALLGCRLQPDTCFDLLRSGIEVTYEDRWLYARVDLEGFGKSATCYGAFTRFLCPGGLQDA